MAVRGQNKHYTGSKYDETRQDWSLAVSNYKGKWSMTAKFSLGRLSLVSPKLLQVSAYFLVTVKQGGRQMRGRGGVALAKRSIFL